MQIRAVIWSGDMDHADEAVDVLTLPEVSKSGHTQVTRIVWNRAKCCRANMPQTPRPLPIPVTTEGGGAIPKPAGEKAALRGGSPKISATPA